MIELMLQAYIKDYQNSQRPKDNYDNPQYRALYVFPRQRLVDEFIQELFEDPSFQSRGAKFNQTYKSIAFPSGAKIHTLAMLSDHCIQGAIGKEFHKVEIHPDLKPELRKLVERYAKVINGDLCTTIQG